MYMYGLPCTPLGWCMLTWQPWQCFTDVQFNVGDEEQEHVKWYKNRKFWTAVASVLITEALLISAIVMVVFYKHQKVVWFEWWRWLFFFSGELKQLLRVASCTCFSWHILPWCLLHTAWHSIA